MGPTERICGASIVERSGEAAARTLSLCCWTGMGSEHDVFAIAFDDPGAILWWLRLRMPTASEDDASSLVAGWNQARGEVDFDVALAPTVNEGVLVGGVQCMSSSVASSQVSIPAATGAGVLAVVPRKRMRGDAGVDTTLDEIYAVKMIIVEVHDTSQRQQCAEELGQCTRGCVAVVFDGA